MRTLRLSILISILSILLPVAAVAMSQKAEIETGREAMQELRKTGFTHEKPLTQVGNSLQQFVTRKDLPWDFFVLEDKKSLNAFALPGGFVFVTRPYYEKLTVDELAFVVGHEMTHIDKKHSEQSVKRARTAQIANLLASLLASKAGNRALGQAADLGANAYYTKYSRKLEREADLGGFTLTKRAGFNPNAAVTALSKLGKDKSDPITANIFATHPILSSREDRLAAMDKSSTIQAAPRPNIQKTVNPNWKPTSVSKDDLRTRPGIALRVVGDDGTRWDRTWRGDFRDILGDRIEQAGRFDVRGDGRADGKDTPDLTDLRKADNTDWLLVVTVHQMSSDPVAPAATTPTDDADQPKPLDVKTTVKLSAKAINTTSNKATDLGDINVVLQGTDSLVLDGAHLYPDMTVTQAVFSAVDTLVTRIGSSL